jgi:membrane-associated phospholipid phosphatase
MLGGAASLAISEALLYGARPLTCRWCDRDSAGNDSLNAFDRAGRRLRWDRPEVAAVLSNVTGFVVTPLLAGGITALAAARDGRGAGTGPDLLVMAESGVLSANLNQLVKVLVRRERPYAHALRGQHLPRTPEDNLSFFSGHTSESASLAVAAGTVASLRGYRMAPLVWSTALPMALFTGYLRVGADRHYLSDVLIGAASGALVGALVPLLFHAPAPAGPGPVGPVGPVGMANSGVVGQPLTLGCAGAW